MQTGAIVHGQISIPPSAHPDTCALTHRLTVRDASQFAPRKAAPSAALPSRGAPLTLTATSTPTLSIFAQVAAAAKVAAVVAAMMAAARAAAVSAVVMAAARAVVAAAAAADEDPHYQSIVLRPSVV